MTRRSSVLSSSSTSSSSSTCVRFVSARFWALSLAWMLGAGWGSGTVARQWLQRHVANWVDSQHPLPPLEGALAPSHCPIPSTIIAAHDQQLPLPTGAAQRQRTRTLGTLLHRNNQSGENHDVQWEKEANPEESSPSRTTTHRWDNGRKPSRAASPTRMSIIDNAQEQEDDDEAFARPLVHRTLLSHPHPQRIAILGTSSPASKEVDNTELHAIPGKVRTVLREVLRHTTVQEVVVVTGGATAAARTTEFATVVEDPRVQWVHPPNHPASWLIRGSDDDPAHKATFDVILLAHDDL